MASACVAHNYHWPKPKTLEEHHVIPQAWQKFWTPRPPVAATLASPLWDPRTVTLAPTCHRNVHWWIVSMMKQVRSDDPTKFELFGKGKEFKIAYLALERFATAGGSLIELWGAGQLGQA